MITKPCEGCQRSFEAGSNRAKWCPSCKAEQTRAADDRYNAKRGDTTARVSVQLTEAELLSWHRLHGWLAGTKQGRQLLERFGLEVASVSAEAYQGPKLMAAVQRAWYARRAARRRATQEL